MNELLFINQSINTMKEIKTDNKPRGDVPRISLTNGQKWLVIFLQEKKLKHSINIWKKLKVKIRHMQIEIQKKFHFTLTELAMFKKYDNINYWWGSGSVELLCTIGKNSKW